MRISPASRRAFMAGVRRIACRRRDGHDVHRAAGLLDYLMQFPQTQAGVMGLWF
jgi:hypothetical protein